MMQFEYMQIAHPFGIMQAHDLNAYGLQGWGLVGIDTETTGMGKPTGLKVYTFLRALPLVPSLRDSLQTHEHEPRASRRDPVVRSDTPEPPTEAKEQE